MSCSKVCPNPWSSAMSRPTVISKSRSSSRPASSLAILAGTSYRPVSEPRSPMPSAPVISAIAGTGSTNARRWSLPKNTTRSGANAATRAAASVTPARNACPNSPALSRSIPGVCDAHTTILAEVMRTPLPPWQTSIRHPERERGPCPGPPRSSGLPRVREPADLGIAEPELGEDGGRVLAHRRDRAKRGLGAAGQADRRRQRAQRPGRGVHLGPPVRELRVVKQVGDGVHPAVGDLRGVEQLEHPLGRQAG